MEREPLIAPGVVEPASIAMYTVMTSVAVATSELIAVASLHLKMSNPHSSNTGLSVGAKPARYKGAVGRRCLVFRNWTATGKPWTGRRSAAPAGEPVVEVIERKNDRDRGGRDERRGREKLRR